MYDEFESRHARVVAIAQEDKDLESHSKFLANFKPSPRFEVLCDVDRAVTTRYERTNTYLIDREGIVRQIFPSLIHHRPDWTAILGEMDRIRAASTGSR